MSSWLNRISNSPQARAVRQATENLPPGARVAAKAGATGVAVGVAVFAVPPLLGFTTAGVAAGSLAAAIQSAVYGAAVPAGSIFAIMQSVGATATIVPAVVAGAAAAAGTGAVSGGGGGGGGGEDGNGNGGPHRGQGGDSDDGPGGPHKGGPRNPSTNSSNSSAQACQYCFDHRRACRRPDGQPDHACSRCMWSGRPCVARSRADRTSQRANRAQDQQDVASDSSEDLPAYDEAPAEDSIQVLAVEDQVDKLNRGSGGDEIVRSRNNTY